MVYSASIALPDNPKFARYAHTHFLTRHTACRWSLAFVAALLAFQVPVGHLGKMWRHGFLSPRWYC
jgi:cell division protein FtsW